MGTSDNDMPIKGDTIDGKHGLYVLGEEVGHGETAPYLVFVLQTGKTMSFARDKKLLSKY